MKIADPLSKELRRKLKQHRHKKQRKEKIDWHDLMGVNRDTYRKVNGKWRSK